MVNLYMISEIPIAQICFNYL